MKTRWLLLLSLAVAIPACKFMGQLVDTALKVGTLGIYKGDVGEKVGGRFEGETPSNNSSDSNSSNSSTASASESSSTTSPQTETIPAPPTRRKSEFAEIVLENAMDEKSTWTIAHPDSSEATLELKPGERWPLTLSPGTYTIMVSAPGILGDTKSWTWAGGDRATIRFADSELH